jgi:hypothetical protein
VGLIVGYMVRKNNAGYVRFIANVSYQLIETIPVNGNLYAQLVITAYNKLKPCKFFGGTDCFINGLEFYGAKCIKNDTWVVIL